MILGSICHLLLQWSCLNLLTDRYFHLTKITGISYKPKHGVKYPSLCSSVRPVLHSQDLPGPKPPQKWATDDENSDNEPVHMEQEISDPDFQPSTSNEPHFGSQCELVFVGKLSLSKGRAEFLG